MGMMKLVAVTQLKKMSKVRVSQHSGRQALKELSSDQDRGDGY